MTFVCTAPTAVLESIHNGNKFAVIARVGFDDALNVNYQAMVGLGGADGGMEYYFCILQIYADGYEKRIWKSSDLPPDCSKQHRSEILTVILNATKQLLQAVEPRRVYRMIDVTLPAEALAKHVAVSQIFISCGYKLTAEDTNSQHRVLRMER